MGRPPPLFKRALPSPSRFLYIGVDKNFSLRYHNKCNRDFYLVFDKTCLFGLVRSRFYFFSLSCTCLHYMKASFLFFGFSRIAVLNTTLL